MQLPTQDLNIFHSATGEGHIRISAEECRDTLESSSQTSMTIFFVRSRSIVTHDLMAVLNVSTHRLASMARREVDLEVPTSRALVKPYVDGLNGQMDMAPLHNSVGN